MGEVPQIDVDLQPSFWKLQKSLRAFMCEEQLKQQEQAERGAGAPHPKLFVAKDEDVQKRREEP